MIAKRIKAAPPTNREEFRREVRRLFIDTSRLYLDNASLMPVIEAYGMGLLPFTLAHAISLDDLKALAASPAEIERRLPHPRTLLPEMPSVTVDDEAAGRLRNGMQINLPDFSGAALVKVFTSPTELLAIAKRIAGTLMQPIVVLG